MDSQKRTKPPDQFSEGNTETDSKKIVIPIVESVIESFEKRISRKRKAKISHAPDLKVQKHSVEVPNVKIRQIGDCTLIPLEQFPGDQLPTKSEILRRFFHLRDMSHSRDAKSIAEEIFQEIEFMVHRISHTFTFIILNYY